MATNPIETFADVLHRLIDDILHDDEAAQAHAVVDQSSGTRTPAPEQPTGADPAAPAGDTSSTAPSGDVPAQESSDPTGDPTAP